MFHAKSDELYSFPLCSFPFLGHIKRASRGTGPPKLFMTIMT